MLVYFLFILQTNLGFFKSSFSCQQVISYWVCQDPLLPRAPRVTPRLASSVTLSSILRPYISNCLGGVRLYFSTDFLLSFCKGINPARRYFYCRPIKGSRVTTVIPRNLLEKTCLSCGTPVGGVVSVQSICRFRTVD